MIETEKRKRELELILDNLQQGILILPKEGGEVEFSNKFVGQFFERDRLAGAFRAKIFREYMPKKKTSDIEWNERRNTLPKLSLA
mmetsp:Transcript_30256/g.46278  ORF Transcript_30256/g.46278 Transcript_30256/m.46278 type:complete len:85 (+) Transcript_30256:91-345(+)